MALLLKANGEQLTVHPANPPEFSLQETQGMVGGYIEAVTLNGGRIMLVNEDGIRLKLPFNGLASALFLAEKGHSNPVLGDAVVLDPGEIS